MSNRFPDSRVLEVLVEEVFAQNGISVEYRYYPWMRSHENVKYNNADGTFPWIRSEDREDYFLYSEEPVIVEKTVFFHLESLDFHWDDFSDLRGYKIGGTIGYAYVVPLVEYGLDVEYVQTEELNFRKILAGRINLYPASEKVGYYIINFLFDRESAARFTRDSKPLSTEPYFFLVSRKNPDGPEIIRKFDEGLRALKANGRYDEILSRIP